MLADTTRTYVIEVKQCVSKTESYKDELRQLLWAEWMSTRLTLSHEHISYHGLLQYDNDSITEKRSKNFFERESNGVEAPKSRALIYASRILLQFILQQQQMAVRL